MLEQQIEHPGGLLPLAFRRRRGIVVLALQNGSACDGLLKSLEYQLALHDPAVVRQGAVKPRVQRAQTGDDLLPVFTGEGAKEIQSLSGEQHRYFPLDQQGKEHLTTSPHSRSTIFPVCFLLRNSRCASTR